MPGNRAAALVQSESIVLFLCLALFVALIPFTPDLLSSGNFANILANLLPLLIVALGQTLVLIGGGIDLSQTSTIALASVVGGWIMNGETGLLRGHPAAVPVAVVIMLLCGAVVGLANGFAIARLRMPAFMVTLTSMMFVSGLAIWFTQSRAYHDLPASFVALGSRVLPSLVLVACVGVFVHVMLSRSLAGRWLYAVGQNSRAAWIAGIPVDRVVIGTYVASGVLAALGSVLYTGRLETASPVHGQRILLDVIGSVVLGGTSLFGGRGRIVWTLYGVLFLTVLDTGLNLLDLSHFTIMMAKGAVILLAAGLDATRNRWRFA